MGSDSIDAVVSTGFELPERLCFPVAASCLWRRPAPRRGFDPILETAVAKHPRLVRRLSYRVECAAVDLMTKQCSIRGLTIFGVLAERQVQSMWLDQAIASAFRISTTT